MADLYGAKCIRCAHIRHDGDHASEPVPWLDVLPMECTDCDFCQSDGLVRLIDAHGGLDLFTPDVRDAVRAFRDGKDHPLIDQLRAEIQATERENTTDADSAAGGQSGRSNPPSPNPPGDAE